MILTLANIFYVLIAIAMTALILMQRGAGAAAGSGFGGGASSTVFGARGAGNFLSKSTAVLAILFFAVSLGMAMYATRGGIETGVDLGVMGAMQQEEANPEIPRAPETAQPVLELPQAPEAADGVPAAEPVGEAVQASPAEAAGAAMDGTDDGTDESVGGEENPDPSE